MSKKWLALALKFLVSGFLIWFLLSNIDLGAAKDRLLEVDPAMLGAGMLVLFVQTIIGGFRWAAVLTAIGKPLGFLKSFQLFYIGAFFNQSLPSSVGGDAVRMYKAYRHGLGLRAAVNGVVLERAVTVVALVVLVDATQPWFAPRVDEATMAVILPGIVLVTLAAAVGLVFLMLLDRLPAGLQRWRLVRGLGNLGIDARRVFLSVRHLPRVLAWGMVTHVNISLGVFLLATGLALDVTWLDCLVLVPPVLLVMTLPISIAGWGVRETAMVAFFGLIGVPAEGAVVLSILFGLVGIVVSLPGGAIWLATRDKGESMDNQTLAMEADEPPPPADAVPGDGRDA
ncbi:MAG: flippase-like domain-containing protein [Proteobacteria bacterium]|nr:flippase-like domain-containing protein [Pseudomonadota bacterium]